MAKKTKKKEHVKITVGNDEFCFKCMEWREYDDNGKCKVCGKLIKKKKHDDQGTKYDDFGIDANTFEESDGEVYDSE